MHWCRSESAQRSATNLSMPHVGKGALAGPHLGQDDAKGIDVSRLGQLALYEQLCSMAARRQTAQASSSRLAGRPAGQPLQRTLPARGLMLHYMWEEALAAQEQRRSSEVPAVRGFCWQHTWRHVGHSAVCLCLHAAACSLPAQPKVRDLQAGGAEDGQSGACNDGVRTSCTLRAVTRSGSRAQ